MKPLDEPITYRHAFGWSAAAVVALLSCGFVFGNSLVSRAEAAAGVAAEAKVQKVVHEEVAGSEKRLNERLDDLRTQVLCRLDRTRCPR